MNVTIQICKRRPDKREIIHFGRGEMIVKFFGNTSGNKEIKFKIAYEKTQCTTIVSVWHSVWLPSTTKV